MFRFVHTADVHLDSPLKTLALKSREAADCVANATRQSFINTVDVCLEERVNALLIAGDLYDGSLDSYATSAFFTKQMRRLEKEGIRVFMIRGNHDAESVITRHLQLPDNVTLFPVRGRAVEVEGTNVVIHGASFPNKAVPESLLPLYKAPVLGKINIGMLHTSLSGAPGHDTYAPCSLQDLWQMGYHYWALGHIHKRSVYEENGRHIVMPGIPQGRHINESGNRSITLVNIAHGSCEIEERQTGLVQFERIKLDISGMDSWQNIVEHAVDVLKTVCSVVKTQHIIVRLHLTGATPLAALLRRDRDVLLEELCNAGRIDTSLFIEQITDETSPYMMETKSIIQDPIGELRQMMQQSSVDSFNVETQMQKLRDELLRNLPPDVRGCFKNGIKQYLDEGAQEVLAQLADSSAKEGQEYAL